MYNMFVYPASNPPIIFRGKDEWVVGVVYESTFRRRVSEDGHELALRVCTRYRQKQLRMDTMQY